MFVHLGNPKPIEAVIDPRSGEQKWRRLPPDAVTTFYFPEDTTPTDAVLIVLDALPHHMDPEAQPVWVESDNKELTRRLCLQFDIQVTKNKRPANWGKKETSG